MYHNSTQRKYWTFRDEEEIAQRKNALYRDFFQKFQDSDSSYMIELPTMEELDQLYTFYEFELLGLCKRFDPPMPATTVATAIAYMKRFYLVSSMMDYHPGDIMLACIYLATKVDEYNISIDKFLTMVPEKDKERAKRRILGFELLVMEKLKFHLTIHCPYRPVEGLLIGIRTSIPEITSRIDELRNNIDKFLAKLLHCQALLIYPPSQIALAALIEAGQKAGLDLLGRYVRQHVMREISNDKCSQLLKKLKDIQDMSNRCPSKIDLRTKDLIEEKVRVYRNENHNPDSHAYKRLREEEEKIFEQQQAEKRTRLARDKRQRESKLLR